MFTVCSFQLFFGKLYTFYSLKWTFLAAIGIFEVGSLICGMAQTSAILIVGRAVAGIGCSGIFSGGLIILAHSVELRLRPLFTGIVAAMYGVASVIGPILGGLFTESRLTWRWCFYINLPVGAIAVLIIMALFTPPARKQLESLTFKEKLAKFDLPGTFCLIPSVVSLLLALQWGGAKYKWKSGTIVGLLVTAAVLAVAFVVVQIFKKDNGTLPPRIICQRSIACGALYSFCIGSCFFMLIYYVSCLHQP
jgi:MFS family permease